MSMNDRIYYSNEAARRAMMQRNMTAMFAAVLGLAFGAVLALILAPQSGDKTRRVLGERVEEIVKTGVDTVNNVANTGAETVNKVANGVREQVQERLNSR